VKSKKIVGVSKVFAVYCRETVATPPLAPVPVVVTTNAPEPADLEIEAVDVALVQVLNQSPDPPVRRPEEKSSIAVISAVAGRAVRRGPQTHVRKKRDKPGWRDFFGFMGLMGFLFMSELGFLRGSGCFRLFCKDIAENDSP
jgi:hypothetical protein